MAYRVFSCLFLVLFAIGPVRAVEPNEVVLCEHVNGGGQCYSFKLEPYMRHLLVPTLADFGDKASSVYVGSNVWGTLYEHSNFSHTHIGDWNLYPGAEIHNLDDFKNHPFSNKASSLIVFRKTWSIDVPGGGGYNCHPSGSAAGVTLLNDRLFKDSVWANFFLPESNYQMEARYPRITKYVDDKADEARVAYGSLSIYSKASNTFRFLTNCVAMDGQLFRDVDFRGQSATWPLPHSGNKYMDLEAQGLKDAVSSVIVRVKDRPASEVYWITVKSKHGTNGTTANVFLTLYGQAATVGRLHLKDKNNFDGVDPNPETFRFAFDRDIGFIEKIRLAHDYADENPCWLVEEVRITHGGEEWTFPFSQGVGPCSQIPKKHGKRDISKPPNAFETWSIVESATPPPPGRVPGISGTEGERHRAPSAKPPVATPKQTMPQATSPVVPNTGTIKMTPTAPVAKLPPGVVPAPVSGSGFLDNRDFPGNDLPNMPIVYTQDGSPDRCAQDCAANENCAAFTYVKPRPDGVSLCWLKWPVADEAQRTWQANTNTVSGTRPTLGQQAPPTTPAPAAPPVTSTAPPTTTSPPAMPAAPPAAGSQTENFNTGLDSRWQILRPGMQVKDGMLTCDGGPSGASWNVAPTANFRLNFKYRHGTGVGAVVLNYDKAQPLMHYRVWLLSDRAQIVRRSGKPDLNVVAESDMNQPLALVPGHLYDVTITVNAGQIGVAIDGRTQVTYTDPQPLLPGGLAFGCGEGHGFAYDDIEIN